ncbi:MAG: hypothetical protein NT167_30185 [Verrucomicrobia bacterium]|nr:hypothetical protein [Verrucomicrobiota bacterium]
MPEDLRIDEDELLEVFGSVSLQRELDTGKQDSCGRFDEAAVAWDVARPWVDLRARDVARRGIGRGFTGIPHGSTFSVLIAHDVDRTTASEPFSILNSLLGTLRLRRGNWWSLATALSPGSLIRNIERLLEFERSQRIGAHFFMLSGPYGFGRYSSRTDIRWASAREIASLIQQAGMPIGLHGSFAARERSGYREEKDRLEQAIGCAVTTHRNHYLRFAPAALYSQLETAAIRFDLSVGFVSRIGFRAGCARSHRTFDLQKRRTSSVFSVPQLFMDTVLQYRSPEEILVELREALLHVKAVQGCVCLVFHPETFLMDSHAWPLLRDSIRVCQEMGADLSGRLPSAPCAC